MLDQRKQSALIILSGIFTASLIASNLLGSRLIDLFGVTVSLGLFVFPFTFLTADVITELFGKPTALKVVRVGIYLQIYVLAFVELGCVLPGTHTRDVKMAYQNLFGLTPRMVLASIAAYSVSQWLDVKVFAYLKGKASGRFLILRVNAASWFSQLIDTLVFSSIFLGGVLPFGVWCKSFLVSYAAKIIVGTFDSPFVKLAVLYFLRKESHESLLRRNARSDFGFSPGDGPQQLPA